MGKRSCVFGHIYGTQTQSHKDIVEFDREAKARGMTYGQYQAYLALQKGIAERKNRVENTQNN